MKKKKTLWNGVSVLIVTVLAIMAFTRGYVQLGLMAVAFTAWSVWAIIRFLVPFVSAKLEKRQAQKIRKHYEEEERRVNASSDDGTGIVLLRHVNHRITAHLQTAYPGATWEWRVDDPESLVAKGGTGRIQVFGVPDFNYADVSVNTNAEINCEMLKIVPMSEIHRIRGRQISMIFQEPMTSLNPVFTIGNQLDEVVFIHTPGATKEMAKRRSLEMLELVGIAAPERVYNAYPHELSGGMRQRVMISMALACDPRLIIADEPTTALDVTIQAQILDLLRDLKNRIDGSIMLITHDLGIIAEMADYVVVMYAGRIIERGTVQEIFHNPMHPYTIGLQKSKPTMDSDSDTLFNIPGNVPNPVNMPKHCFFKERCSKCIGKCSGDYPGMIQVSPTHYVACHLYGEEEANG